MVMLLHRFASPDSEPEGLELKPTWISYAPSRSSSRSSQGSTSSCYHIRTHVERGDMQSEGIERVTPTCTKKGRLVNSSDNQNKESGDHIEKLEDCRKAKPSSLHKRFRPDKNQRARFHGFIKAQKDKLGAAPHMFDIESVELPSSMCYPGSRSKASLDEVKKALYNYKQTLVLQQDVKTLKHVFRPGSAEPNRQSQISGPGC